jgi:hypothetical protein
MMATLNLLIGLVCLLLILFRKCVFNALALLLALLSLSLKALTGSRLTILNRATGYDV